MFRLSVFIILILTFVSCIKNNPDPSWIEIDKWTLEVSNDPNFNIGAPTHNFSDAWVYIDGDLIGVFELPCRFPILKSGSAKVQIFPAILDNGISATKKIYPFVRSYEINVDLIQNETVSILPSTSYYEETKFWIEDFEDSFVKIATSSSSLAQLESSSDAQIITSLNGGTFGRISMDNVKSNWIANTTGQLNLPRGSEIYLEIDYHNTCDLTTGVLALSSEGNKDNVNIRLNKQDVSNVKWKKIYISLREIVSTSTSAEYFEITFNSKLPSGFSSGEINIDNIKIVHF